MVEADGHEADEADHEELHERQQRLQRLTLSGPVMQEYKGNGLDARVIAVDALYFKVPNARWLVGLDLLAIHR